MMQYTLAQAIECDGISLHKGEDVRMTLRPAPENHGIVFKRTDVPANQALIAANYKNVTDTRLCTVLENGHGHVVSTVEHLMAAFWGCGIDNALVEINGSEVPIMDGSSDPFVFLIECVGKQQQRAPRRKIVIDTPMMVEDGESCLLLMPAQSGFALDVTIDFNHEAIGTQSAKFDSNSMTFRQILSRARTFGFLKDVEMMQKMGLAKGGSLHNAVVIDDHGVMNEDGYRYDDECVRHKMLDCIGDYFLSGHYICGKVRASRPGHAINNKLMKTLFANPDKWHYAEDAEVAIPAYIASSAVQAQMQAFAGL
jgi:UDP-3-O-[3-hydroxymyristoyl] N-acetylglucosamine deacetylase